MDRTAAREAIKNRIGDYLQAIGQPKKNKDYVCPICNSGGGNNGNYTTAFKITPNGEAWHCFSCGNKGDIYNLIALQYNKDIKKDFAEILNIAAAALGVALDNADNTQYTQHAQHTQHTQYKQPKPEPQKTIDYSDFLRACKAEVTKTSYYKDRGLNDEVIERFNLGVVTDAILTQYKAACHLEQFWAGDLVIPYNSEYSYFIGRNPNIKPNEKGDFKHKKPKTEHAGREPIFNEAELDLHSNEPIFITEAPLDAISIEQAGGAAIAIGGTGQDKIEAALDKRPQLNRPFIIAFDNPKQDNAGQTATEKLKAILDNRGIKYTIFNFADSVKDTNDYLIKDKGGFYKAVIDSIAEAKKATEPTAAEPTEAEIAAYNAESGAARLKGFINGIKDSINTPPTATGFNSLDEILEGGLYEGLYILGAVSSLGKTTLLLQIADQIAKGGRDVLIFSLEMAAAELMAKSISRETFYICKEQGSGTANAKTVRGILDYSRYKNYSKEEIDTINKAIFNYRAYAGNIFINEGIGNIGIEQITQKIAEHKKIRGKAPVIIIDYLQILAPYSDRASDKQNTDKAVLELKRIARDEKTPVLAISSFNRGNYSAGANMAAFKESGAIEYSSDVLIALQPCGMKEGESNDDNAAIMNKCKASTERNIEAVILKNRNGRTGTTAIFKYYSMFNCFEEIKIKQPEFVEVHGLPSWEDLPTR